MGAVPLDDGPDLGRRCPSKLVAGPATPSGPKPSGIERVADDGGLVAGVEAGGVDAGAVGRHRERARRVREQGHDGQRSAAEGVAERVRVEHPHVRAPHARDRELGIERDVLAAMRRRDERSPPPRSGEHDVAWLVADEERALDVPGRGVVVELDDAHAVREVVDHPDFAIRPRRDGDRLEAHRDGGGVDEPIRLDAEDLEAVIGRVDGEQVLLVRRQRERAHLPALEQRERGSGLCRSVMLCDPDSRIRQLIGTTVLRGRRTRQAFQPARTPRRQ